MIVSMVCEALVVILVAGPAIVARLAALNGKGALGGAAVIVLGVGGGLSVLPLAAASSGCLTSSLDFTVSEGGLTAGEGGVGAPAAVLVEGDDPTKNDLNKDAITYRDLATHPGCTTEGVETRNAGCPAFNNPGGGSYSGASIASIPGYKCAAKTYPADKEDKTKPILLLIHGNSDAPSGWEANPKEQPPTPMIAERALEAGFRVFAVDFRFDKVDDPGANLTTENAAQNFDHGWAVPIAQSFFDSLFTAYPDRKFSIVGFSLGPTIIRDALRRLHRANKHPFERIQDLVLAAGGHHGVSSYRALCDTNPTMRGRVACELGDLKAFKPTPFLTPLNGPDGAFETPCADGDVAYGQKGVCGKHKVRYTTLVMKDKDDGSLQDEFVSQGSAALKGANNLTVPTSNPDVSKYFCEGLLDDHYGAVRSEAALKIILDTLTSTAP